MKTVCENDNTLVYRSRAIIHRGQYVVLRCTAVGYDDVNTTLCDAFAVSKHSINATGGKLQHVRV